MPKISVIVPNYNHARFLEQRIESILNQDFQDFELILLDDYSTDNSKDVLERYRHHPKVSHLIFNERNSGSTFYQWEKGINLAKGEFIWIAESDDCAKPNFLSTAISKLNSSIGVFYAEASWINQENIPISIPSSVKCFLQGKDHLFNGSELITQEMIIENVIINTSGVVFSKKLIDPSFNEHLNYKYCGDWLFWCHIFRNTKIFCSAEKLNLYRSHNQSVTKGINSSTVHLRETFNVLEHISKKNSLSLSQLQKSAIVWGKNWNIIFPVKYGNILEQWNLIKQVSRFNLGIFLYFLVFGLYSKLVRVNKSGL